MTLEELHGPADAPGASPFGYEDYEQAARAIRCASDCRPEIAVVLGSGLGGFSREVTDATHVPYARIPHFPVSTAPSHAGEMLLGRIEGRPVCVLSGRFHYYEGYSFAQAAFYVGALKLAGIKEIILTNASGGIDPGFKPGDLMLVRDHIKFAPESPSRGRNDPRIGERFFDMTKAYPADFRARAKDCAENLGIELKEGVYAFMAGPQFETPAEVKALRLLGADAVGMSTVPEVIEAVHWGIRVLCVSCVTNYAAGLSAGPLSGEDVSAVALTVSEKFRALLRAIIKNPD